MQGKDIHNLVLVKLDEFTPFSPNSGATLLAGGDNLDEVKPIYRYVSEHLAEAANEMLAALPIHRLGYKSPAVQSLVDGEDNRIGVIPMPADYLRLHTLWMKGWSHPVHGAIKPGHPLYSKQFNEWSRGHADKPVVVETGRGEDKEVSTARLLRTLMFTAGSSNGSESAEQPADWVAQWDRGNTFRFELQSERPVRLEFIAEFGRDIGPDEPHGAGALGDETVMYSLTPGERVSINVFNDLFARWESNPNNEHASWIYDVRAYIHALDTAPSATEVVIGVYEDSDATEIVHEDKKELHYYSCAAAAEHPIKEFKYIPYFDERADYDCSVAEVIALHCARKVCEVFGMVEQAKVLTEEFNSVMENMRL